MNNTVDTGARVLQVLLPDRPVRYHALPYDHLGSRHFRCHLLHLFDRIHGRLELWCNVVSSRIFRNYSCLIERMMTNDEKKNHFSIFVLDRFAFPVRRIYRAVLIFCDHFCLVYLE